MVLKTFDALYKGEFTVEVDETTNMPVVPEGYYWRVTRSDHVELRKVGRLTCVAWGYLKELTPQEVAFRAACLWDDIMTRNKDALAAKIFRTKYVGDYPPKVAQ